MQENKFENEVQKIMNQLSLDPTDAVWTNVAGEIEKDKKRRRPLLWIFFIAGPLFIGAGYFFISDHYSKKMSTLNPLTPKYSTQLERSDSKSPGNITPEESGIKSSTPVKDHQVIFEKRNKSLLQTYYKKTTRSQEIYKESGDKESGESNTAHATPPFKPHETWGLTDSASATAVNPVLKATTGDSISKTSPTKKNDKKTNRWKFGFTGGVGLSEINQDKSNLKTLNFPSSSPGSVSNPGTVYNSNPESGISFTVGAFVYRNFSTRISVSAGLIYHYYSTKVNIGNLVNNSGINYMSNLQYAVPGFYVNNGNNSYTNQYHFAELPVSIDFTLNKSPKMPLIWEAGFSFAYLVSTNALYFDPVANVYYKNEEMLNRSQWNVNTALMIGLNLHGSRLLVGPQLQYGLSGLLQSQAVYTEHLIFYGLKISLLPNFKK